MEDCDREKIRALMKLARVRIPEEEACKYIADMEALTSTLQEIVRRHRIDEPLYYVWEEGYETLEAPIIHGKVDLRAVIPDKVDDEGRVVLPWRPRG